MPVTQTKKPAEGPATRGGWIPVGTGAKRREAHAQRSRPRGRKSRMKIVDAARAVFEELGYESARVEDIVEKAQVGRGTFYTYFESKLEIFREVTDNALASIDSAVTARPPADIVGTANRLAWTNELFIKTYAENAKIMGLLEHVAMVDEYIHERRLAARQMNVQRIAGQIKYLQKQDRANPDLDPTTAARLLVSMLSNFAYWSFTGGDGYDPKTAQMAVSQMWLGAIGFTEKPVANPAADRPDRTGSPDGTGDSKLGPEDNLRRQGHPK